MLHELYAAGGIVMGPIALASLAAWWLALSCALRTGGLQRDLAATRRWFDAPAARAAAGSSTSVAAAAATATGRRTRIELAEGEIARLGQLLRLLGVLVGILPLLGLLGTVSGMIGTFNVIQVAGMGDPRLLAGGIREALVATETGLATALPALLLHQLLAGRLRRAETEQELLARRLARRTPRAAARFGDLAVALGYVSAPALERSLATAPRRSLRIGEALLAAGRLSLLQRRIVLALQGRPHD